MEAVDELREVARVRAPVAALDLDVAAVVEDERESRPTSALEEVAARQLAHEPRQHRLRRWRDGQCHRRRKPASGAGFQVEPTGLEPVAFALPARRSPS